MRRFGIIWLVAAMLLIGAPATPAYSEPAKWRGTDQVIEELLQQYGIQARDPYINTDQGDFILFVFALGGLVAGLVIGYQGRRLFVEMEGMEDDRPGPTPPRGERENA